MVVRANELPLHRIDLKAFVIVRWSLAVFSINVGQPWVFVGTMFNTAIMIQVTNLTETRMLVDAKRKELFRKYQKETSVWFPFPPSKIKGG